MGNAFEMGRGHFEMGSMFRNGHCVSESGFGGAVLSGKIVPCHFEGAIPLRKCKTRFDIRGLISTYKSGFEMRSYWLDPSACIASLHSAIPISKCKFRFEMHFLFSLTDPRPPGR
jgi:hypothetical protein